ncbi:MULTISPECIES: c-type cytochrome [Cellvibrio]|uniref:Cytochrome c553 n=1 Tax=Cellvibrio fibrivorans TaxID=126350 RepID=A0ABU1UY30_9GAMM|nr:c-type cytochrome [Cellvibrio fibrivorans]MDR7090065.1 cytochrome c553 [Cellvibrio fibrivorans]
MLLRSRIALAQLLVLLCLCAGLSVGAQEPDYSLLDSASADNGKLLSNDERCQECHGVDGNIHANNEAGKIPKLAGQHPAYLLKQFNDFRSGDRHHDFMAMMARTVDDETAADIFAHYAAQPVMRGSGTDDNLLGKKLYLEGDGTRQIQACAICHGIDGRGLAPNHPSPVAGLDLEFIPIIGGQDWHYLDQQLRDWRSGERTNSSEGIMNNVTANLRDDEIKALTDYISRL